jgi:alpha-1,3-mannosyl-glycoprotein beta-1,2-N-acetylglucosaminyltransferase
VNEEAILPDGGPVIAVLVFACNRITVSKCIDQLLKYRPARERFPIIVSQECGHRPTAHIVKLYGDEKTRIEVSSYIMTEGFLAFPFIVLSVNSTSFKNT